jgi:alpha-beta hydrolase superfamily lysophospholipase
MTAHGETAQSDRPVQARIVWRLLLWLRTSALVAAAVLSTIVLVRAFDARRLPDLGPWHRIELRGELRAQDMGPTFSWSDYRRRENALFAELRARLAATDTRGGYRYQQDGPLNPQRMAVNWNRSFEFVPKQIRGGVLLIHGMTDSPYSMRNVARLFAQHGYYALVPRMPGHGTIPAGLAHVRWQDWRAAVRVGARRVHERIGQRRPFFVVGYSSGGALALQYALDATEDVRLTRPDRVVLLSPMIGVSRIAGMSRVLGILAAVPYFEKSAWLEVQPEYDPFKYNSFPVNGGLQSHLLTGSVQAQLRRLQGNGALARLPPILGFQSALDTTVDTGAVVHALYDRLPANGSELVLFDINRNSNLAPMISRASSGYIGGLLAGERRRYRLTAIGNTTPDTAMVSERTIAAGQQRIDSRPLALAFPDSVFSLSHLALPFPIDDPLFGLQPRTDEDFGIRLGTVALHGERDALNVSMEQLMRLNCNPFYPYLGARIEQWIAAADAAKRRR